MAFSVEEAPPLPPVRGVDWRAAMIVEAVLSWQHGGSNSCREGSQTTGSVV